MFGHAPRIAHASHHHPPRRAIAALAALGSLAGLAALTACATPGGLGGIRGPQIRDVIPSIESLDLEGVSLVFDVGVDNPLPVPIISPKFQYSLNVKGKPLISEETPVSISLPASGLGRFKIPARVEFAKLAALGLSAADAPQIDYELKGKLLAPAVAGMPALGIPVSFKGAAPVFRAPVVKMVKLEPAEFSTKKLTLQAEAEIMNPNLFPIDVRRLKYELTVGGETLGRLTGSAKNGEIPAGATGHFGIAGEVTAVGAIRNLFNQRGLLTDIASLESVGSIKTPYGQVELGGPDATSAADATGAKPGARDKPWDPRR